MNIDLLRALKKAYREGKNISLYLKDNFPDVDESEVVRFSYELQAGSYVRSFLSGGVVGKGTNSIVPHFKKIFEKHVSDNDVILDFGTGEMTLLTSIFNSLDIITGKILGCDISWSRLFHGIAFCESNRNFEAEVLPIVCSGHKLPFPTNGIDITYTTHALEPNKNNLDAILSEIFRVTQKRCIFTEPSYEIATKATKARMDRLGYIRQLASAIERLGGVIIENYDLSMINPNNPSSCYVVEPPNHGAKVKQKTFNFTVPGTNYVLTKSGDFYESQDTGLVFPSLNGIPILELKNAILATAWLVENGE